MSDIIYVAVIVAFFALAALFVRACDRIIGPDETATVVSAGAPNVADVPSNGHSDGRDAVAAGAES